MTIKLDTTLEAFEKDGGDENFIKSVTKLLDIDRKLMIITQKRQGSVIVQAAEGGIEGLSVDALMREVRMDEGSVIARNEQTFQNTIGGLNDQMAGARGLQEQRYMNSSTGNLAELGLSIAGAGLDYKTAMDKKATGS